MLQALVLTSSRTLVYLEAEVKMHHQAMISTLSPRGNPILLPSVAHLCLLLFQSVHSRCVTQLC